MQQPPIIRIRLHVARVLSWPQRQHAAIGVLLTLHVEPAPSTHLNPSCDIQTAPAGTTPPNAYEHAPPAIPTTASIDAAMPLPANPACAAPKMAIEHGPAGTAPTVAAQRAPTKDETADMALRACAPSQAAGSAARHHEHTPSQTARLPSAMQHFLLAGKRTTRFLLDDAETLEERQAIEQAQTAARGCSHAATALARQAAPPATTTPPAPKRTASTRPPGPTAPAMKDATPTSTTVGKFGRVVKPRLGTSERAKRIAPNLASTAPKPASIAAPPPPLEAAPSDPQRQPLLPPPPWLGDTTNYVKGPLDYDELTFLSPTERARWQKVKIVHPLTKAETTTLLRGPSAQMERSLNAALLAASDPPTPQEQATLATLRTFDDGLYAIASFSGPAQTIIGTSPGDIIGRYSGTVLASGFKDPDDAAAAAAGVQAAAGGSRHLLWVKRRLYGWCIIDGAATGPPFLYLMNDGGTKNNVAFDSAGDALATKFIPPAPLRTATCLQELAASELLVDYGADYWNAFSIGPSEQQTTTSSRI